jgi:hypothetical protein
MPEACSEDARTASFDIGRPLVELGEGGGSVERRPARSQALRPPLPLYPRPLAPPIAGPPPLLQVR